MRFHTLALPSAVLISTVALPGATAFGLFHPSTSHVLFKVPPPTRVPQQQLVSSCIFLSTSKTTEGGHLIDSRSSNECDHAPPIVNPSTRDFNCELNRLARSDAKGSAQEAESMLLAALDRVKRGDDDTNDVFPNVVSFSTVINCWSRSYLVEAPERAWKLMELLEQRYRETQDEVLRPNKFAYGALVNTLARSRDPDAALKAEAILHKMGKLCEEGDKGCCPDEYIVNKCINAWSRSADPNAPERALALLDSLERPSTVAFTSVMQAYSQCDREDGVDKCEELLERMNSLVDQGYIEATPNFRTLNCVMQAYAKKARQDKTYAERADELLRSMEERSNAGSKELRPTTASYNICLKALANCRAKDAAKRADILLNRMIVLHGASGSSFFKPDKFSFGSVIKTCVKASQPDKAARVFKKMLNRYDGGDKDVSPTRFLYNTVLDGFATASRSSKGYGKKAERLLVAMENRYDRGNIEVKPNLVTYNLALAAISRSREKWVGERAEAILDRMQELYEDGDEEVRPDALSYGAVIRAHATARKKGSGSIRRAGELLQRQIAEFKSGHEAAKPNRIIFSTVINALSTRFTPAAAEKACVLLGELEGLRRFTGDVTDEDLVPDTALYNSLLKTISMNQLPENAIKAEEIVRQMEKEENAQSRPNLKTYNTLINCWAHSESKDICGKKAMSILEKLEGRGDKTLKPDDYTYNTVIKALARSLQGDAAEKAEECLERMKSDESIAPDCRTVGLCFTLFSCTLFCFVLSVCFSHHPPHFTIYPILLALLYSILLLLMRGPTPWTSKQENERIDCLRNSGSCTSRPEMKERNLISSPTRRQ